MDDYGYFYDMYYGFEFYYNGRSIGKSKTLSRSQVEEIPDGKSNGDSPPLFVNCKKCYEYMDFTRGWYQCPVCGKRVKERTLLVKLDKENQEFDNDYEEYWDY